MPISNTDRSWRADLWWYLGLVVASGLAFGVGQGVRAGVLAAVGMLVFTVVLAVGRRRSDAVRVVGGAGDERNRELYNRSLATAGAVLGLTVTGWYLLGVAQGRADGTLLVLTVLFAAVFLGAAAVNSQRG
jgi:hypothetical protein